jgi:hypothetical protein
MKILFGFYIRSTLLAKPATLNGRISCGPEHLDTSNVINTKLNITIAAV